MSSRESAIGGGWVCRTLSLCLLMLLVVVVLLTAVVVVFVAFCCLVMFLDMIPMGWYLMIGTWCPKYVQKHAAARVSFLKTKREEKRQL